MSEDAPNPVMTTELRAAILDLLRKELTITFDDSYGYYESYEMEVALWLGGELLDKATVFTTR